MAVAPPLLASALARARAEWLAGDPEAWERYTDGLARLEQHLATLRSLDRGPARSAPRPLADRPSARA
jgi:hypothetical protein